MGVVRGEAGRGDKHNDDYILKKKEGKKKTRCGGTGSSTCCRRCFSALVEILAPRPPPQRIKDTVVCRVRYDTASTKIYMNYPQSFNEYLNSISDGTVLFAKSVIF